MPSTPCWTFTQGSLAVTGTGAYAIQNGQLGSDNQTLLVFTDSTGDLTIDTTVSGGLGGFTKQGSGALILNQANSYSGSTIVGGGTLRQGVAGAVPADSALIVADVVDAVFELNGFDTNVASLAGGGSVGGTVDLGANNLTVGSDGSDGSDTTFGGILNGSGTFTKAGTGTLTLTGSGGLTGSYIVNEGILNLQSGNAVGTTGGGNSVGPNATLQLQGGITVNKGTVTLNEGAAPGQNGALVNVSGSNTINDQISIPANTTVTIAADSGTLTLDNGGTTILSLTTNSDLTLLSAAGATLNVGTGTGGENIGMAGGATNFIRLRGDGNGQFRTVIASGGADGLVIKDGAGTWTLARSYNGANGWTALAGETAHLRINEGTIALGANNAISYGNNRGLVEVNDSGTLDINGFTTNLNGLSNLPGQTSGTVTNNGDDEGTPIPATLTLGHADSTAVYNGTIQDGSATLHLTKTGTGSQSLLGTNSLSGDINVSGGTLVMAGNAVSASSLTIATGAGFQNVPGAATPLNLGNGSIALSLADGSTLGTQLGATITVATGSTVSAAGTITVDVFNIPGSSPSGTFTLASAADGGFTTGGATYQLGNLLNVTDFTLSNFQATDTALTIDAAAATPLATAYWLGGQVTGFEGVWAISDGTTSNWSTTVDGVAGQTALVPGAGTDVIVSITPGTNTPSNQGTMTLGSDMSLNTLSINDPTPTVLEGGGFALDIQNSGGNDGVTLESGAGAAVINTSVILGGTVPTITNNSTTESLTIGGEVSGTAGVTKAGPGTLIFTAANTYTGGTTINDGTLQVGNGGASGSLGSGAITGSGSATLAINRTGATTVNDTINVPNLRLDQGTTRLTADTTVSSSFVSAIDGALETTGNITLDLTAAATATNAGGLRVVSDTLTILPSTVDQNTATPASFHYSFDNSGSPFVDDSGANPTQYNGVASENTSVALPTHTTAGKVGGAVTFNGTDQGFQAGGAQNTILSDAESVLTYASWIKLDSVTNPSTIIFEEGGGTNGLTLWTENGDLRAAIQNGGSNPSTVTAAGALTTGWHHVAVSYSDSTFRLYLDGALVDSAGFAATLSAHGDNSGIGYLQGSTPVTPTGTRFSGAMDEIYYFDDAGLTASEIASLVNGTSVVNMGTLTLNDGATVNLDGSAANSSATLFGPVNAEGDATLTGSGELIGTTFNVDPDKTLTINNVIAGRVGLTVNGPGTVQLTGTNTFDGNANIKGGTLAVSSDANLGAVPTSAEASRILIDGGTLRTTADLTIAANRGITIGPANGSFQTDSSTTATVDGVITGAGTLTKTGEGTLLLNSDSSASFAGITQITEGTLQLSSAAATGAGDLIVNGSNAVLSGTGTVTGNTSVILGSIAPGDPVTASGIGTLTLDGATTDFTSGTVLDLQITHLNGLGSVATNLDGNNDLDWTVIESAARNADTSDILTVSNVLNLTTDATINLAVADAGTFEKGMAWDLLDWGTLGTSPTSLNFNVAFAAELSGLGLALDTSRFATHGIIAIVPEPSRLALLALGALGFLRRRRAK
jgi:autotransporter-associated beta strand protein